MHTGEVTPRQQDNRKATVIRSVEITGFRGIRQGQLDKLTPIVILVGGNGSGKSSVLDAIHIAGNKNPFPGLKFSVERRQGTARGGKWLVYRGAPSVSARIDLSTDGRKSRVIVSQTEPVSGSVIVCEGWHESLANEFDKGVVSQIFVSDTGLVSYPDAPIHFPHNPAIQFLDARTMRGMALHRLYTRVLELGQRDRLTKMVKSLFPALSTLEILAEGDRPTVYLTFQDYAVPAAIAGDGIYWILQLACEAAALGDGVLLIEEPETHLSPVAMQQLVRIFRTAASVGTQIIFSTHSLELIDLLIADATQGDLDNLSLYHLRLDDGKLTSTRFAGSEVVTGRLQAEIDLR